jgi:hypothetical protein
MRLPAVAHYRLRKPIRLGVSRRNRICGSFRRNGFAIVPAFPAVEAPDSTAKPPAEAVSTKELRANRQEKRSLPAHEKRRIPATADCSNLVPHFSQSQ